MGLLDIFRATPARLDESRTAELAAALAPSRPLRRASIRGGQRFMSGADMSRLSGDWTTQPVTADAIVSQNQRVLVARSREQAVNNDYVRAFIRHNRQNIVGRAGVLLQSKAKAAGGIAAPKVQTAIEAALDDWGRNKHCDITGKLTWRGMQAACVESCARDGEFFAQLLTGRRAGKYGFALKLLDPQRCPVDFDRFDMRDGVFIRHGIEFSAEGRPLAYYFADDTKSRSVSAYSYGGRDLIRIPAEEILHGFIPDMIGQKRGLPWLVSGLFRAKQMGAMEEAAVTNARVGAAKMGVIEFEDGAGPEWDDEQGITMDAEAGAFIALPSGGKLNKFDPNYPNGEFAGFIKLMLRALAAGGGMDYETLAQDREGVNYTSIRHGTLETREGYMERQEWLVAELCEPVFARWLDMALLSGAIVTDTGKALRPEHAAKVEAHEFQPRRWDWVDPTKDVSAARDSIAGLLSSPGQHIREKGRDPSEVWREIGRDIAEMRAAGIDDEFIKVAMGLKLAPAPVAPKQGESEV